MSANLLAIIAMALATYATRAAGLLLADRIPHRGRLRAAMDALPPAVLTAVIAPAALSGPAEAAASVVAIVAAMRLPLLGVVAAGVAAVILFRMIGG